MIYCSGAFLIDEVPSFTQSDLVHDQVAVLDVHTTVFMWVGSGAMDVTRAEGSRFLEKYIKTAPNRNPESVIVAHGSEPSAFTQQFLAWRPMTVFEDPYKKRKRLEAERLKKQAKEAGASVTCAEMCTVDGPGLNKAADEVGGWVGMEYRCVIAAHTGDNERCTTGGDVFVAELTSDDMFRPLKANVVDESDGTYTVSFVPRVWGQCEVNIWCEELDPLSGGTKRSALGGSPFPLWIEEAQTLSPDACRGEGEGLEKCEAGVEATFEIVVEGVELQNASSLGWKCELELREPANIGFMSDLNNAVLLPIALEHKPGTHCYQGAYTAVVEGSYALQVVLLIS